MQGAAMFDAYDSAILDFMVETKFQHLFPHHFISFFIVLSPLKTR
jgi:hypothetical protein